MDKHDIGSDDVSRGALQPLSLADYFTSWLGQPTQAEHMRSWPWFDYGNGARGVTFGPGMMASVV